MSHIQKIINYVVKRGNGCLLGGALIREGRLVQNGSKGGGLIGGRRLFERGRLIEDLRYSTLQNKWFGVLHGVMDALGKLHAGKALKKCRLASIIYCLEQLFFRVVPCASITRINKAVQSINHFLK